MNNQFELNRNSTFLPEDLRRQLFTNGKKEKRPPIVTISRPRSEVFQFVRDFRNLAPIFVGIQSIQQTAPGIFHWVAGTIGELKNKAEWDTQVIAEEQDSLLAWQSIGHAATKQAGAFVLQESSGGKSTIVVLELTQPTALESIFNTFNGMLGAGSNAHAEIALRRLKALLETGEIPTIEGQPNGKDEKIH